MLLGGALLRLPQLWAPLWNDEAFVWVVSGRPLAEAWAALAGDVHPPLFYSVEWIISKGVHSPLALRLFPFACGLAVVWLGAKVAQAAGAPHAAQVLAAAILALAPQQIYYSAEVRMYSLLAALYLAGAWCVLSRRWGWLAVCLAAMLYTHHYGWIYAAVLGSLAIWLGRDRWRRVVMAGAIALTLYLPLLPVTLRQLTATGSYWAGFGPESLPITLALWFAGAPLDHPALGGALIIASLALIMAAAWRAIVRRHYTLLWLAAGPLCVALALSLVKNVWMTRAFIGAGAAAAVLLAMELSGTRRAAWASAGLVVPMLAVGALMDQTRPAINDRYATPTVAAYLRRDLLPGDVVLCLGSAAWMELQPYQLPATVSLREDGEYLATGGLSSATRQALGIPDITGPVSRVWIFKAELPGGLFNPAVPDGARLVVRWTGTEKVFSASLYLLEDLYGYNR